MQNLNSVTSSKVITFYKSYNYCEKFIFVKLFHVTFIILINFIL